MLTHNTITLRDEQWVAISDTYRLRDETRGNILCVLPTGSGKCHGKDTPVLMYDGTVKMIQDVKVGDLMMGPDSTPRKVLLTHSGVDRLYKVKPVKGESYVVNSSHVLSLKQTGLKSKPKYKCQEGKGDIINIPVEEYIKSSNNFKHTHKGWRTGVDWQPQEVNESLLPPYLLGVWLGDGTTSRPDVTSADVEISEYVRDYCERTGHSLRVSNKPDNKASTYHISRGGLLNEMRRNNLIGNKHIPDVYKINSRDIRMELLAGILDSDGYLSNKHYDVVFKVERLANDLVFLARSLGFAVYVTPCVKTCTNTGVSGNYFRISISGDVDTIPTKLKRHQCEPRRQKKSVLVTGLKVEDHGVGEYYGVTIDGDNLYLLGDFTVTHNSLTLAEIARQYAEAGLRVVIFAHRDVLISQLSEALCKTGITHNFICSKRAELAITNRNHVKFGDSFHNATSLVTVSSNPTFNARIKGNKLNPDFLNSVALVIQDESHHATRNSSWGNCFDAMPNSTVIGFTATPLRNDGKGLGIHASSYFSAMSVTTTMFDLIKKGSLSPYKIFCPESDIDLTDVNVTSSGDYNQTKLGVAMDKRHITGDAIEEYQRIAGGHKAITFCVNINHATHVSELFNANGIPSAVVSSKMTQGDRDKIMTDFEAGRILNLVNVDLIGEGYDCPAVTVAIMLRPTQSYSLFKQQFGRVLRTAPDKHYGVVIDHVGNVEFMMRQYGLRHVHDDPIWSLDDAEKASKKKNGDDDEPMETMRCPVCAFFAVAEDFINGCPDCGHIETPSEKEERIHHLQEKKGNLIELSFDVITEILKERERVDLSVDEFKNTLTGLPQVRYSSALNSHAKRLHAQTVLRDSIQTWCESFASESGLSPALVQREFEVTFGENILKAQTLSERKAMELNKRICSHEMYRTNQTVQ